MYSPKILPDLIPRLYRKAKERGIPMTKLVNEILTNSFNNEDSLELCAERTVPMEVYSTDYDNQSKEAM